MRLRTPDLSLPVNSANIQLTKQPDWHSCGVNWTHSWDMADAVTYVPDAAEQAYYGITATPRIDFVPDRGTGNKALEKDAGAHGPAYGMARALPGPLYIENSKRFRRRPAAHFDLVKTNPPFDMYSCLTPNQDWTNSADYFNAPGGITPPWFIAMVVRPKGVGSGDYSPWDCTAVGTNFAGPTVIPGNQYPGGGTDWSCANWSNYGTPVGTLFPHGVVSSGHAGSANESVMVLVRCAAGTNQSNIWVYWRTARGKIVTNGGLPLGTMDANPIKEMFFGWLHTSYMSHAGIVDDNINFFDLGNLVGFLEQVLTPASTVATEP